MDNLPFFCLIGTRGRGLLHEKHWKIHKYRLICAPMLCAQTMVWLSSLFVPHANVLYYSSACIIHAPPQRWVSACHCWPQRHLSVILFLLPWKSKAAPLRLPICNRCKIGLLASEDKPKPNREINVFLLLSDSHLSLTHTPLAFQWSRTNVGIWPFTCLPATEQWCSGNGPSPEVKPLLHF